MRPAAFPGLLLGMALATAPAFSQPATPAGDLERLREAIEHSRAQVAAYEREERGLLEALEAIEHSAALLDAL